MRTVPLLRRRCALAFALLFLGAAASAETITVFAAASLRNALDAVAAEYEADTGDTVTLSYAGSSTLARQITLGAPADVFISANPAWMDTLDEAGLLEPGSRVDLLGNRLVLIAHDAHDPIDIAQLPEALGEDRLSMALVEAVPAGIYGKAALETLGLWQALAPHIAQSDNVRSALALVSLGETPFGIVYATDAVADANVSIVYEFAPQTHPAIRYPAAAIAGGKGAAFLTYLLSPAAAGLFAAHGFTPLDPDT